MRHVPTGKSICHLTTAHARILAQDIPTLARQLVLAYRHGGQETLNALFDALALIRGRDDMLDALDAADFNEPDDKTLAALVAAGVGGAVH